MPEYRNFEKMEVNKIYTGKMEEVLKDFPDNCVDSIVTDPPYGLKFMGKHWDYRVPTVAQWSEAIRVLKPGGFLLSFGGTRTYHRMVVNIEDAGFEIRDQIQWLYGSGFPKSLDISKAIDKQAGAEREIISEGRSVKRMIPGADQDKTGSWIKDNGKIFTPTLTNAATDPAKEWEGWGTALKPACECICVARKPVQGTVAQNVLKWGTGGLNIDGCRVEFKTDEDKNSAMWGRGTDIIGGNYVGATHSTGKTNIEANQKGRFPANVIMDEFIGAELDRQSGLSKSVGHFPANVISANSIRFTNDYSQQERWLNDNEGGASRFFYCPKPDNYERQKGCSTLDKKNGGMRSETSGQHITRRDGGAPKPVGNHHPTVKPIDLMRYLVKLVTPKGGICLDPFCGSGTTLIGCKMEIMNFIGIDMDAENVMLAEARVKAWNPDLYKPQKLF